MNILILNAGSSSLKYQLINMTNESVLAKGLCDRIGIEDSIIKHTKTGTPTVEKLIDMPDHTTAMAQLIKVLIDPEIGVIADMSEIKAVGHRVVHGGEKFYESVIIDQEVMNAIEDCIELAPLHNPANITGIKACKRVMPNTPNVAVFDTAFHQTIKKKAYIYAIPYEYYTKYGIRKYGFHGTSHQYVAQRAAKMLGRPLEELKIVTCHLGNGASVCAIDKGKSVDTSMGFTPLAGLAMGTRSGTIDPAVIFYIMRKENLDVQQMDDLLNKKSGVLGLSGVSSDFRDLHDAADAGNERAALAIDLFCYRVKKYLVEYIGLLNGCDAVVFTAGIGENNAIVRKKVLEDLDFLGIEIDQTKNLTRGKELDISAENARIRTLIIPTNEELAIARETMKLI